MAVSRQQTSPPAEAQLRLDEEVCIVHWEVDPETMRFVRVSDNVVDLLGFEPEKWLQKGFWESRIHPDDRAPVVEHCERETRAGQSHGTEYRMLREDGSVVWVYDPVTVEQADGVVTRVYGLFVDVTQRVRAQERLADLTRRYEAAAEVSGHILYEWIPETNETTLSGHLESILGWTAEDVDGMESGWLDLVHPEDRDGFREALGAVVEGAPSCRVQYRIRRKDGEYTLVEGRGKTLRDPDGQVLRSVGFVADLTERRRAEAERQARERELQRARRMESLGILAGGIAHDFNNLLTLISGYTERVASRLPAESLESADLARVTQSTARAAELVRQVLTYSRRVREERRAMDLVAVVREAVELIRPSLPSGIRLTVDLQPESLVILGAAAQIHSVVVNLLTNAWHAMEGQGGRLTVRLESASADDSGETTRAVISVRDEGSGMTEEEKDRVFEPFFTTKPVGQGSGLGMAVAHSVVADHDGSLEVESRIGEGTVFRVVLPAAAGTTALRTDAAEAVPKPPMKLRVLAVDDEQEVLRLVQYMLEEDGATCRAYTDPREALAAFEQSPNAYDLLLTDFKMPGMDGLEVSARATGLRPELPVILITGFAPEFEAQRLERAGVRRLLHKPFSVQELRRALAEACAGTAAGVEPT